MKGPSRTYQALIEENFFLKQRIQELEQVESERKRAEEALRESEEKYRVLFEGINDAVFVHDLDEEGLPGRFLQVNDMACRRLGYTREELLSLTPRDITMPEEYERIADKRIVLASRGDILTETIHVTKNGLKIPVESNIRQFQYFDRQVALSISRDISERKQAAAVLQASEENFRRSLDESPLGIRIVTAEGETIYANWAILDIHGYDSVEDLKTTPVEKRYTPESFAEHQIRKEKRKRGDYSSSEYEISIIRKNGEVRHLQVFRKEVLWGGERHFQVIYQDITDRKQAEDSLRVSEERFRALSENAPDIIYTMNLDGAVTYVNPSWKRILGHDEEDLLGRYFNDFAREEDRRTYRKLFKSIRDDRKSVNNHIGVMLTKDGAERVFNMNSAFNRDLEGRITGVVGTMKDITEQREMEKKLSQAQKMESIGTLAGGIAHDFNNLLMGIQGYASLMLLDIDPSHPHYERLKRIEQQVQSGADLTKQLLGFARGGRYEVRPTDMNDIIDRTSSMFGRTKKEIAVHRSLAEDIWAVDCDQGQMEQVLMNLYVNAWQAMPGGGELYLETGNVLLDDDHAMPYTIKPGRYVKVSITDTGTGMDAKTRERIFDPFFTTKARGRGTGLGLAMVYGIIKGHGGMIDVTSEPGQGTTFDIYLPATEKAIDKKKLAATEILTGTETVLLVDDEQMVLEVTRELLESLGYRVHAAGSGQEAIAVYLEKRKEVDLVILDMIMPGLSGGETFDRLREIDPEIRVLLSSGYSIDGEAQQILERGCNGFLQKPFQLEKLSRKVREILD